MISHTHNFIFVHINKTGGSSIEVTLNNYGIKKPIISNCSFKATQHLMANEYQEYVQDYNNYFKFTIVRNPWDRVVSYYHWGAIINELNFNDWLVDSYYNKNFIDYQRMYEPCINWITDKNNNIMVDYISRFENLQEDFNTICDKIGISKIILPHEKKTNRAHYREYYTEFTKKIIEEYFKEDIKTFGYQF